MDREDLFDMAVTSASLERRLVSVTTIGTSPIKRAPGLAEADSDLHASDEKERITKVFREYVAVGRREVAKANADAQILREHRLVSSPTSPSLPRLASPLYAACSHCGADVVVEPPPCASLHVEPAADDNTSAARRLLPRNVRVSRARNTVELQFDGYALLKQWVIRAGLRFDPLTRTSRLPDELDNPPMCFMNDPSLSPPSLVSGCGGKTPVQLSQAHKSDTSAPPFAGQQHSTELPQRLLQKLRSSADRPALGAQNCKQAMEARDERVPSRGSGFRSSAGGCRAPRSSKSRDGRHRRSPDGRSPPWRHARKKSRSRHSSDGRRSESRRRKDDRKHKNSGERKRSRSHSRRGPKPKRCHQVERNPRVSLGRHGSKPRTRSPSLLSNPFFNDKENTTAPKTSPRAHSQLTNQRRRDPSETKTREGKDASMKDEQSIERGQKVSNNVPKHKRRSTKSPRTKCGAGRSQSTTTEEDGECTSEDSSGVAAAAVASASCSGTNEHSNDVIKHIGRHTPSVLSRMTHVADMLSPLRPAGNLQQQQRAATPTLSVAAEAGACQATSSTSTPWAPRTPRISSSAPEDDMSDGELITPTKGSSERLTPSTTVKRIPVLDLDSPGCSSSRPVRHTPPYAANVCSLEMAHQDQTVDRGVVADAALADAVVPGPVPPCATTVPSSKQTNAAPAADSAVTVEPTASPQQAPLSQRRNKWLDSLQNEKKAVQAQASKLMLSQKLKSMGFPVRR